MQEHMSSIRYRLVVACAAIGLLLVAMALPHAREAGAGGSAIGSNPIPAENALPGTDPDAWLPPSVPPTRVQGYASEISVLPGQDVHLHVSTAEGDRYRVEVYRLGWYGGAGARLLACLPSCGSDMPGRRLGSGTEDPSTGVVRADWPVTDVVPVPAGSVGGYYYALLRLTSAGDDTGARGYVPFIVRDPASRRSQILVQVPVNTWQAYNPWGGKSLYPFNSTGLSPAVRVSFDRPLAFTSQGPFDAEYNLVRFLEHEGYDVSYQTDVDTDLRPESLLDHRLVVVAGHDEYWSKRTRDAFDAARALGTNLAFTGSNAAYWQIRYEDSGRTIVGYKEAAPDPEPDPSLRTIRFRQLTPPRPECELMGVMFHRIPEHIAGARDYTVTDAATSDPWFAGTGFRPGDTVLDVVGSEWDALPEAPAPAECIKPGLTTLFHYEGEPANADAVRFTAPSGARVFAGGAQQLSWSLDPFNTGRFGRTLPADTRLQQFMRNALADLAHPAAPRALEARDEASHRDACGSADSPIHAYARSASCATADRACSVSTIPASRRCAARTASCARIAGSRAERTGTRSWPRTSGACRPSRFPCRSSSAGTGDQKLDPGRSGDRTAARRACRRRSDVGRPRADLERRSGARPGARHKRRRRRARRLGSRGRLGLPHAARKPVVRPHRGGGGAPGQGRLAAARRDLQTGSRGATDGRDRGVRRRSCRMGARHRTRPGRPGRVPGRPYRDLARGKRSLGGEPRGQGSSHRNRQSG